MTLNPADLTDEELQLCLPTGPYRSCQYIRVGDMLCDGLGQLLTEEPQPIKCNLGLLYAVLENMDSDQLEFVNCAAGLRALIAEPFHTTEFLWLFNELINQGLEYWINRFNIQVSEGLSPMNWAAFDRAYSPSLSPKFKGHWSYPSLTTLPLRIWANTYKPGIVEPYSLNIVELLHGDADGWIINTAIQNQLLTVESMHKLPIETPIGSAFEHLDTQNSMIAKVRVEAYNLTLTRNCMDRRSPYWQVATPAEIPKTALSGYQSLDWFVHFEEHVSLANSREEAVIKLKFHVLKNGCDYDELVLNSAELLSEIDYKFSIVAGRFYRILFDVSDVQREAIWEMAGGKEAVGYVDWALLLTESPSDEFTKWVLKTFNIDPKDAMAAVDQHHEKKPTSITTSWPLTDNNYDKQKKTRFAGI